jgi:hypothetical protein
LALYIITIIVSTAKAREFLQEFQFKERATTQQEKALRQKVHHMPPVERIKAIAKYFFAIN